MITNGLSLSFAQLDWPIEENISFLNYKKWATCIAGVCGLKWVKTFREWWVIKQLAPYWPAVNGGVDEYWKPIIWQDKIKTAITPYQIIRKTVIDGLGNFQFVGRRIGDYEIRRFYWFSCGWGSFEQQVFDRKGKKQNTMAKTISLWDIIYKSDVNFYSNYEKVPTLMDFLVDKKIKVKIFKTTFTDLLEYQEKLSTITKDPDLLDSYYSFFKKPTQNELWYIPVQFYALADTNGLVHKFTINQEPLMKDHFSEFFSIQKFYMSSILDEKKIRKWFLMDFDITKMILEQYIDKNRYAVFIGGTGQEADNLWRISSLEQLTEQERLTYIRSYMPLFKVVRMWDYHVFMPNQWNITLQVTAEMCKPLVYIYDKDNRSNSLTLKWTGLYFTKLIPTFNSLEPYYTWNYNLKDNKPLVEGKLFDYLYYSVKVPNYLFNTNAVAVPWSEMSLFFEQYLPVIGFNTKEYKDFVEYRKGRVDNQKNYAVSVKYNHDIDKFVALAFSTPYKVTNRVLFEFRELEGIDTNNDRKKYNLKLLERSWIIKRLIRNPENEIFERGGVYRDMYGNMSVY